MAQDLHIFIASSEACPVCAGLDGSRVPPGYTAHANCHCQTVPPEEDADCTYEHETTTHRDGSAPMDAIIEINVTVTCPDGSEASGSTSFDAHSYGPSEAEFDRFADDVGEAIEEFAQSICDSCPPKEPFRCC
jgi:hypothetical protein